MAPYSFRKAINPPLPSDEPTAEDRLVFDLLQKGKFDFIHQLAKNHPECEIAAAASTLLKALPQGTVFLSETELRTTIQSLKKSIGEN